MATEIPTFIQLVQKNSSKDQPQKIPPHNSLKKQTINCEQILSQQEPRKETNQKELTDIKQTGIRGCWTKLTLKKKIGCIVGAILLLAVIILTPLLIHLYVISPNKVEYDTQHMQSYKLSKSKEQFTILPVTMTQRKLFGANEVYTGDYVIFKQGNLNGSEKVEVMVSMTDKQSGITVKKFNGNDDIIVEIDPRQLMMYSYKNDQVQTKRLLAQIALTQQHDHLDSISDVQSKEFAKELLDVLTESSNMTQVDTQLVLQEQYEALRTPHGFELKKDQSSLFEKSTKRNLFKRARRLIRNLITKPVKNLVQNTAALLIKPPRINIITTPSTDTQITNNNITNTNNTNISTNNITNTNNTNISTNNINTGKGNVTVGANNTFSNTETKEEKKEMVVTREKTKTTRYSEEKDQKNFDTFVSPKAFRAGAGCTKIEGGQRCAVDQWLDNDSPYQVVGKRSPKNKESDYVYVFSSKELMELLGALRRIRRNVW